MISSLMKKRFRKKARSRTPGKSKRSPLPIGKLPTDILARCLDLAAVDDPSIICGPGIGADAAVLAPTQTDMLVLTSDPITFTDANIGPHLLAININDVVTTGGFPRWLVLNLLLPVGTTEKHVSEVFKSIVDACRRYEILLVGGHTEITDAVTRTVAVGTLVGLARKDRRIDPSRSQPGDDILLIGPIAIEGTALLARERRDEIIENFGEEFQKSAEDLLEDPGICISDAALLACGRYLAHALHDPTEGGLATALRELAAVTACGVEVEVDKVEILPQTATLCEHFGIDPLGLLASGSLLAVLPPGEAERLSRALRDQLKISSSIIGRLTEDPQCVWRKGDGQPGPIPVFPRDEIVRVLEA
jgi:hydrogenase maturation factor